MSIRYTVRPCDNGDFPLVDRDEDGDDISDYIDEIDLRPRGRRPQNHTVLVQVCKKNNTQAGNSTGKNATLITTAEGQERCQLKRVRVTSLGGEIPGKMSEGEIPQEILEEIERDGEWTVNQNGTEPGEKRVGRQRRQAEGNWTGGDISSGASEDGGTGMEIVENRTDTGAEDKSEERRDVPSETFGTTEELEEGNEISLNGTPLLRKDSASGAEPSPSEEMGEKFVWKNLIQAEPEPLTVDLLDLEYNYTAANNNQTQIGLSLDYDDYGQQVPFSVCLLFTFIKYM